MLQLTGSALAVGSVLTAAAVPRALLMLLGGAVNDLLSPRLTIVLSGLLRAVVMGALAALALANAATLPVLFLGSFLIGAISAFFIPAPPALLPRVVEHHQLEAGNAMMQLNNALVAFVWRDVPMRAAWVLVAVINLAILGALEVGIPVLAREQLQGPISFGVIFTALGLARCRRHRARPDAARGPRRDGRDRPRDRRLEHLPVEPGAAARAAGHDGAVMSMVMLAGLGAEPIELATGGAIASRSLTLLLCLCAASMVAVAAASTMSRSVRQMS